MASEDAVDVLIIGAGPGGLMCGYILSQAGLKIRIVDQRSVPLLKGQAGAIQPRGTEIMESLGLGQKVLANGGRVYIYTTYKGTLDGKLVRVSQRNAQKGVNTRFNYMLMSSQASVEGIFRDAMASKENTIHSFTVTPETKVSPPQKCLVEYNTRPTQLSWSDDPAILANHTAHAVIVKLEDSNGRLENVRAKYVLGCDGAHSWTRDQLGIEMVGDTSDQVWGLIDCYVDTNFPDIRTLTVILNEGLHCTIIPREHNMVRFTTQIDPSEVIVNPNTGRVDRIKITVETIQRIIKKILGQYRMDFIGEPEYWGVYVVGQRLASAYSGAGGRVLLVGDACHTHSPHAGQGMNAAMTDAHNLSWKLGHILKGWAKQDLLGTYEFERRNFARELLDLHDRMAEVTSGKVEGNIADLHMKSTAFVAGTGVRYATSSIVDNLFQDLAPGILIGGRFPHQVILRAADCWPCSTLDLLKSDSKYKLLVFTGDTANEEKTRILDGLSRDFSTWLEQSFMRAAMIQVYTIMRSSKDSCSYTIVPGGLRSAWDTVFMDDIALTESDGGGRTYETFGIDESGCMVVVRPDAHVAGIVPLDGIGELIRLFEKLVGGERE